MSVAPAPAKINLALVVGPRRADGKHELVTVFQRISLADRIQLDPAPALQIGGFPADTIVRSALVALAERVGIEPRWRLSIEKNVPVAAGLGGGSSDAATALRLANDALDDAVAAGPLPRSELLDIARSIGADVPFFLGEGPQLGQGDGSDLSPLELPLDYSVLLLLPHGTVKRSTADVYEAFDARGGERGFPERRSALTEALKSVDHPTDLGRLPMNDLASSLLSERPIERLRELGAFRADVSGAGPTVYGLFEQRRAAETAAGSLLEIGTVWLSEPSW